MAEHENQMMLDSLDRLSSENLALRKEKVAGRVLSLLSFALLMLFVLTTVCAFSSLCQEDLTRQLDSMRQQIEPALHSKSQLGLSLANFAFVVVLIQRFPFCFCSFAEEEVARLRQEVAASQQLSASSSTVARGPGSSSLETQLAETETRARSAEARCAELQSTLAEYPSPEDLAKLKRQVQLIRLVDYNAQVEDISELINSDSSSSESLTVSSFSSRSSSTSFSASSGSSSASHAPALVLTDSERLLLSKNRNLQSTIPNLKVLVAYHSFFSLFPSRVHLLTPSFLLFLS